MGVGCFLGRSHRPKGKGDTEQLAALASRMSPFLYLCFALMYLVHCGSAMGDRVAQKLSREPQGTATMLEPTVGVSYNGKL